MPDAIWIDREDQLAALASELAAQDSIGVDTEFLRERTFFPRLCLLQLSAAGRIWCVDTLKVDLAPLVPALTAPASRKIIHAARQDLEAFYLSTHRVISPLFDTQIAAGCIGLKPQIGYAELANVLLGVTLTKGQTRTDWSKRPLSTEQLEYAADDVRHLGAIAEILRAKLSELGREHWVLEDCRALEETELYEPDPSQAWQRLRGLQQLPPRPRARAKAVAVWREQAARDRDLPRSWILPDAAIFELAAANPTSVGALKSLRSLPANFNEDFALALLQCLRADAELEPTDQHASQDLRPTAEQKELGQRLAALVDARAAELGISAEILAPRGELRALAMGKQDAPVESGWRRAEIGAALRESLQSAA
jgi:ribonuclease D